MVPRLALATGLMALLAWGGASARAQSPPPDDPASFPAHPGREETVGFCTGCHGFKIVAAQGMTREQWEASLSWMTQRHNMPPIAGDERRVVLDYLEKAFPPKPAGPAVPASRGTWKSPFAPN
jgi:hypothetical protein